MESNVDKELRLFVGIPLPDALVKSLAEFAQSWDDLKGLRTTAPENLHITVYFLGATPSEQLSNIKSLIRVVSAHCDPFVLDFRRITLAPRRRQPRMIWVEYHKNPHFRELAGAFHQSFEKINPGRQFRKGPKPHITLARFKKDFDHRKIDFKSLPEIAPLQVKTLTLWSSELKPEGPKYSPLANFKLGTNNS